jgi:uncharacterized membrane protein YfcA
MDAVSLLVLIAAGIAVGLLGGFLGIGGTPLLAPAVLFAMTRLPIAEAVAVRTSFGSALAGAGAIAAAGYAIHRSRAPLRSSLAYLLGPTAAVGAFAGGTFASRLGPEALRVGFAVGALLVAAWMFFRSEGEGAVRPARPATWLVACLGLAIGFFAAMAGMGGAVFTIIVLVNLLGFSMRTVAETSSFVQICGSAAACAAYAANGWARAGLAPFSLGYVHLPAAGCIALGGIPAAVIGARLTHVAKPGVARKVFAVVLVALALHMLEVF